METLRGKFYGVSVGPGDAELMTIKAVRILKECDIIAAPKTHGGKMQALEIVEKCLDLTEKEILPIRFSMAREVDKRQKYYEDAAQAITEKLEKGYNVALVTLGDISVYSTCNYIAQILKAQGEETELIPGVPSFCAIAAKLDIPLCEMSEELHIVPASSETLEKTLEMPGTKVLMKSGSHLGEITQKIQEAGLLEKSSMIVDCGMESEVICRDLSRLPEDSGYFATIIVKG